MGTMDAALFEAPAPGGPRPNPPGMPDWRRSHGPMVNAPWPVVALTAVIVVGYAVQSRFSLPFVAEALAYWPQILAEGRWERLLSYQFLHGNWAHALMNAAFVLAFGAPVARLFGPRIMGAILFFALYLACGVLAALGFTAVHWAGEAAPLVGASGAASGLMGAAARLIGGHGDVGPLFSRAVIGMGLAWLVVNLIMALTGGLLIPGAGGAQIAWEAHLFGFVAGVLAVGPFAWIARITRA